jgi:UDPglucose 6-dehydrogenase
MDTNVRARGRLLDKLRAESGRLDGRTIGILGLAFKANTDDVRESPAIEIARALVEEGARVRAFDPVAMGSAARLLANVELCSDAYAAADGVDALLVLTEWPQFRDLDLERIQASMLQPLLVDGRNLFDPKTMADLGFRYISTGRGLTRPAPPEESGSVTPLAQRPALAA